jgi:hypothetical protein
MASVKQPAMEENARGFKWHRSKIACPSAPGKKCTQLAVSGQNGYVFPSGREFI